MKYKLLLFTFLCSIFLQAQNTIDKVGIITKVPDFNKYKDIVEKKRAFFRFMRPIIEQENNKVLEQRKYIEDIYKKHKNGIVLNQLEKDTLNALAISYRVKESSFEEPIHFEQLLTHVDIVPVELALSQSAIESAWGTSKFAVKANNMFGQWCFTGGCGLVPKRRRTGYKHEVRTFASVNESVASYIKNLNRQKAYKKFRKIRKNFRDNNQPFNSKNLAAGLYNYSAQGNKYVNKIRSMIRVNSKYFFD